jgi:hypothetical protein
MESSAALSVAAALKLILDGLQAAIAAKIADYPVTADMVMFLWNRVNRAKHRFLALAALIAAGKLPRARDARPRAGRPGRAVGADGINWRKWLPLSRFGWLCQLMPSLPNRFGAAQFAGQLRHLLGRPEMRAILAATPKAGRLLAPLCFMIGIEASLLRPAFPTKPPAAPEIVAPEIVAPKIVATEPDAAPVNNAGAPCPLEDARPRAPDPGLEFFVPV